MSYFNAASPPDLWAAMTAEPDLVSRPTRGLSPRELAEFARFWPHTIPQPVLDWFAIVASAAVGHQHFSLIDREDGHFEPYHTFSDCSWTAKGWLAVGGDGSGDYYVVLTAPGSLQGLVCFVDQGDIDNLSYAVATSFLHWLALLAWREALAASPSGKRRTRISASLVRLGLRHGGLTRQLTSGAQRLLASWPFDQAVFKRHDPAFFARVPANLLPWR